MGTILGKSKEEKVRKTVLLTGAVSAFQKSGQKNGKEETVPNDENPNDAQKGETPQENGNSAAPNGTSTQINQPSTPRKSQNENKMTSKKSPKKSVVNDPESKAATKIQSAMRGHKERKELKKEKEMAVKIQRQFRRHRSKKDLKVNKTKATIPENEDSDDSDKEELHKRREERQFRPRPWREDVPGMEENFERLKGDLMESFHSYQNEIDILKWKAEQQIEASAMSGTPLPKILIISSNVPKGSFLPHVAKDDPSVLVIQYDFDNSSFNDIVELVKSKLEDYKPESRAKSLCIYCQGTPGCMYLLHKRCCTSAKIRKREELDQIQFWKDIAKLMSKINPIETIVHVMGCNILGLPSGEMLFQELEELGKPNIIRFQAPLELSPSGRVMIDTYFNLEKYKLWKSKRKSIMDVSDFT